MGYREQQDRLLGLDREAWEDSIKKVLPPGLYQLYLRVNEDGTMVARTRCFQTSCETTAAGGDRPLAMLSAAIYELRDEIDKAKAGEGNE